jgi:hypothetical protein
MSQKVSRQANMPPAWRLCSQGREMMLIESREIDSMVAASRNLITTR